MPALDIAVWVDLSASLIVADVSISNAQRQARESQGAPAAVLTRIKSWWTRSESSANLDVSAANTIKDDQTFTGPRSSGAVGSAAAISRGAGLDPAMGIVSNHPPQRHACWQAGAGAPAGLGCSPSARAFLAPVGTSEASSQARLGAVQSAALGAADAANAAAEQARRAVQRQRSSQQSAAMASLAGSIAAGYIRRDKPPEIGGPRMLIREVQPTTYDGYQRTFERKHPTMAVVASDLGTFSSASSRGPCDNVAIGSAGAHPRRVPPIEDEQGYNCRSIASLYSSHMGGGGLEKPHEQGLGTAGSTRGFHTESRDRDVSIQHHVHPDELAAEIAAVEEEIRRISLMRGTANQG